MSNFNYTWLLKNFDDELIVFDIGAGDLGDTMRMRSCLPKAKIYSFECRKEWLEPNLFHSVRHGIHYVHSAVSDHDGHLEFYPSDRLNGQEWPWSGSIFRSSLREFDWGKPYTVNSIRLDSFCKNFNLSPDFVHIDVQGAEQKVFSALGDHKPKCIWAEISAFSQYDCGTSEKEFYKFMDSIGYVKVCQVGGDALFRYKDFIVTTYEY